MSRNSGKVVGNYQSIIRGVSQQPAHLRYEGQHWEQINVNSDPVRGLCTRKGAYIASTYELTGYESFADDVIMEIVKYRSFRFTANGQDYLWMYRTEDSALPTSTPTMFKPYMCFNMTTTAFVPVYDDYDYGDGDLTNNRWYFWGFNCFTQMGKLLIGATKLPGGFTSSNKWDIDLNRRQGVVWIKGGAYKRSYTVTLRMRNTVGGTTITDYNYTLQTPSSTYPTAINIPAGSTADQIAKITAEYNSAANVYLGTAAQSIQPEKIAQDLATAMTGAGVGQVPASDIHVVGSHIIINTPLLYELRVNDSGDGSLATATSITVQSINELTQKHYFGHIVKVAPKKSDDSDAYYLKAVGKEGQADGSGYGDVVWKEAAGWVSTIQEGCFAYAAIGPYGPGGSEAVSISSSMTKLNAHIGTNYPVFAPSASGDTSTNPIPYFMQGNKQITYLGMFQDRLVVGCGSILNFSRSGDYLNFFRQSVLTLADNDPIEMTSNDTDEDTIRSGVLFDRSLYLIGEKRQYSVNGRTVLTPTSQNIAVVGGFANRSTVHPLTTDNNIFLLKSKYPGDEGPQLSELYQMQYGQVADVTEAYSVSPQLNTYIDKQIIDMLAVPKPNMVMMRGADGYTIYNYRFVDAQGGGERLQSAWDKYTIMTGFVGQSGVIGMSRVGNEPFMAIMTKASDTGKWYVMGCSVELNTTDDIGVLRGCDLDLQQVYLPTDTSTLYSLNPTWATACGAVIIVTSGPYKGYMVPYADRAVLNSPPLAGYTYVVGCPYQAYLQPTLPYDKNYDGSTNVHGKFVVNRMELTVDHTPGIVVEAGTAYRSWVTLNFNGYRMPFTPPDPSPWVLFNGPLPFLLGFENREGGIAIRNKPGVPFRISAITYDAQKFPR